MLELKDLKKFIDLPPEFNRNIIRDIEIAFDEYVNCRAYIRCRLDSFGEDAFKNPSWYLQVSYDILNEKLPPTFTQKLLVTLEQMKKENCYEKCSD